MPLIIITVIQSICLIVRVTVHCRLQLKVYLRETFKLIQATLIEILRTCDKIHMHSN